MAESKLPLNYEIIIYSGTTFRREFRWLPDGVTAQDFTGWTATMLIGNAGGVALTSLSTANGGILLTGTGQVVLSMTPAQTAALKPGVWAYALDLTDAGGDVTRFLRGRVESIVDVKP